MKRKCHKITAFIAAVLCFAFACSLVACGKKPSSSGGQANEFSDWLVGLNHAISYDGAYTTVSTGTSKQTVGGKTYQTKSIATESYESSKFLRITQSYAYDEKGNIEGTPYRTDSECVKVVEDNQVQRNKRVRVSESDTTEREGAWVRPSYAQEVTKHYSPAVVSSLSEFKGKTLNDLKKMIDERNEDGDDAGTIAVYTKTNKDKSISLIVNREMNSVESAMGTEECEYLRSEMKMTLNVTVSGGKIVKGVMTYTINTICSDATKNVSMQMEEVSLISYEFASEKYNAFDMTTDTTENVYTSLLNLVIDGYEYGYLDFPLVGEKYTLEQAKNAFSSSYIIERDFENVEVEYEDLFTFYTDKEMTQLFTGFDAIEEYPTLYVKINQPQDTALIFGLYESDGKQKLKRAYICDAGDTFKVGDQGEGLYSHEPEYNAVSINGTPLEKVGPTSFVVEANKTYVVVMVYNDKNQTME